MDTPAAQGRPLPFPEYEQYDGIGLAGLVRSGQLRPEELLEAAIARVDARDPALRAVVVRMDDFARAAIATGLPDGPLRGVPYVLKDLGAMCTGTVTTNGTSALRAFRAQSDTELVARLKRAGLVLFGKTHSPELGLTSSSESRLFGATHNPWRSGYSAGGSSGGTAAAVAAGMVPMGHATDGGGSIRIPASCCGLFGLKPTRARVPSGPDAGEGWSGLSAGHAITRSVRDSAALLDAVAGPDVGDPYWSPPRVRPYLDELALDPGRLRIAYTTRAWNGHAVDPECIAATEAAARLCAGLGHEVVEASPQFDEPARERAAFTVILAQVRKLFDMIGMRRGRPIGEDEVEPMTWGYLAQAQGVSGADYARALDDLHRCGRAIGRFFQGFDVLLTPTMCTPPHPHGQANLARSDPAGYADTILGDVAFTAPFNASGSPGMSVPLHWSMDGLPIGVQFVGRFGDEAMLFRLAAQLEQAQSWAHRRPLLSSQPS